MKKKHHPIFIQHKKVSSIFFFLPYEKNSIKEQKNLRSKKIKLKIFGDSTRPNSVESGCPARSKIGGLD